MVLEFSGYSIDWRGGIIALVALVLIYMAIVLWRMRRLSDLPEAEEETATPASPAPKAAATPATGPAGNTARTPPSGQQQRAAAYAAASRFDDDDEPVLTERPIAEPPRSGFATARSEPRLAPLQPPPPPPVQETPMPSSPYAPQDSHAHHAYGPGYAAHSGHEGGYATHPAADSRYWEQAAPAAPQGLNDADEERVQILEHTVMQLRHELDTLRHEFASLRQDMMQSVTQVRATQSASPLYSDAMQMATVGHDAATIAERCGIARAEAELVVSLVSTHRR